MKCPQCNGIGYLGYKFELLHGLQCGICNNGYVTSEEYFKFIKAINTLLQIIEEE